MKTRTVQSGLPPLDQLIQGLRLGDNVVLQVGHLEEYAYFAVPFAKQAIREERRCLYVRFASHDPVLKAMPGLAIREVNPQAGFDAFSSEVHNIIETEGKEAFYVFDNLSALVGEWATDELLANFFQITCPYLFELDTVAYFALIRGQHSYGAVARIRDTTQVLIDIYSIKGQMYVHPLKVWDRYAPQMFLPHVMQGPVWPPLFQNDDPNLAALEASSRMPLQNMVKSTAPWESLYEKLKEHMLEGRDSAEETSELAALKHELSRMLIGSHPEFNRLVDAYLDLEDLMAIRERMIGSGRIGGKAAGMLLARRILLAGEGAGTVDFSQVLEPHDSFYIGSDVFFTFLVNNDLFRLRLQLSRSVQLGLSEFEEVERRFLAGRFPEEIMEQFRHMLDYFGEAPIIVRSSSLLEDSFGNAFAGKYRSEYCANQGSLEQRLEAFLRAVKLVYASAINPDAMAYRRERGLGENDELMAILVQRVSGLPYGDYFFPPLAGVAFSRNLYAWTDRIDTAKGMIRLVFGLGTRAVNREGNDYPRMIAVSHPQLRPEFGRKIVKYSQWEIDLLDLAANQFVTKPLKEVLKGRDYPHLHLFASLLADDYLHDPVSARLETTSQTLVLTFNNLLKKTPFVSVLDEMLTRLEKAYGHPLDTEFTAFVNGSGDIRVNLLQCRPMRVPGTVQPVKIPENIPASRILFRSGRTISGGVISGIRYILYIDPRQYAAMESPDLKKSLGRIVGMLNVHPRLSGEKILMMGPGRWGSSNADLGVNTSYADINNAAALVELALEEAGHVPEVSYGTHFFLDLVESQIIYLPVYPDDPEAEFNSAFFENLPNLLLDLLPEAGKFQKVARIFDLPVQTSGCHAKVIADPQSQRAICYLD